MPGGFGGYILIMIVGMLISGAAALWVRSSYSKYSKKMSTSGLTGAQTARMILDRNNLSNIRVEPVAGTLTDHYDPRSKVIRLSEGNFRGHSIAAVSVAAHEAGHALQDASGYVPMKLRAGIFPIVSISSQFWPMAFMLGIFGLGQFWINVAVVLFLGTGVTGSGPHGGDPEVERLSFFLPDVARVHGIGVVLFLLVALAATFRVVRARAPSDVLRRAEILLAVLVAQAAVGYTQYFTGVPEVLVAIHIAGATAVWVATLRFHLALSTPVAGGDEAGAEPAPGVLTARR